MEAKDQRENLSPFRGEVMEEEARGGDSLPLSLGGAGVQPRGTIAAVIVFINITFFITFLISF
jgi:hypothetical protein